MLEFLIIFAAALAGFAHAPVSVILIAAGGLFAMSYRRHSSIYDRGLSLGFASLMRATALRSTMHAVMACGMAFGGGVAIRVVTWG
jgi:hypothetical protein